MFTGLKMYLQLVNFSLVKYYMFTGNVELYTVVCLLFLCEMLAQVLMMICRLTELYSSVCFFCVILTTIDSNLIKAS